MINDDIYKVTATLLSKYSAIEAYDLDIDNVLSMISSDGGLQKLARIQDLSKSMASGTEPKRVFALANIYRDGESPEVLCYVSSPPPPRLTIITCDRKIEADAGELERRNISSHELTEMIRYFVTESEKYIRATGCWEEDDIPV